MRTIEMRKLDKASERVQLIYEVKEKVRLLERCRRKMSMTSIDRERTRILTAACSKLTEEINKDCKRLGL